ncbi:MAG: metallophosphoesterase [Planctomycetaceae bacterium]|jgi:predicted phosphodiesterase|nr:metallophosphoesterase [Planctomycetaceae bacterium]
MNNKNKTNCNKTNCKIKSFRIIGEFLAVSAALIAVCAAIVNYSFRIGYVFIDHETFKGFSEILFYVMIINALYNIGVAAAVFAKKRVSVMIIIVSCLSFLLSLFFWVLNYIISTEAFIETSCIIIGEMLPFIAALFGVPFLLLGFPNLKLSAKTRNIIAVILTVIFVGALSITTMIKIPPFVFRFDAQPIVFDVGTDKYSVVFATNADAQAYVTYTSNGQLKTVYANDSGYKTIGKLHAVKIPRSELDGNQYTAHATYVIERLAYGGKLGKTISTKTYTLKNTTNVAEPKIIAASDWHNRLSLLDSVTSHLEQNIDLVIFNGDYADFYVNEQQVIKYFLCGAFKLTKGEIPAIFVRGNHEVRSNEKIEDLGRKIGLTTMYYQVRRGNNLFTIFDTAESEDTDQWEHDGFYDMAPYFAEQVEWFENLPAPDISVNNIVLMHDPNFTTTHDETHANLKQRFKNKANTFNIDFSVSGHSHSWRLNKPDPNNFNFYRIEDGGRNGGNTIKTLADVMFFRNVKPDRILHTILSRIVLKTNVETYRLSIITVGSSQVIFEGVTDSGNHNSNIFTLIK